jgi:RHS repeat-associated protein
MTPTLGVGIEPEMRMHCSNEAILRDHGRFCHASHIPQLRRVGEREFVTGPTNGNMYNAAGQVLNVQLTGTTPDQDIYHYDPNTGRMTSFEFEVGNTPANLTGTLTWNPNGTLQELSEVDGFNSGGTQNCYSYSPTVSGTGYDDLGRLIGSSCGTSSPWNQSWVGTYSYDQYDNLTKAGNITFNPGYSSSPSNNHELGSATYDANGNMTKNTGGTAVFGWNEFSKLKWTAGSGTPTCGTSGRCATYDAFGRMVEYSYLGTWTELWQVQVPGATVSMNGTTANFGVWPAPGGLGAAVESGTAGFLHRDWLGSMRIASTTNHTVALDQAYGPYGEIYNVFGTSNTTRTEFAGQTADFDFGALFDTPNREFAQSDQGRWLSPDPAGSGWNQYAYVTNPNGQTDPLGLAPPTCNGDGAPCPVGGQTGLCGNLSYGTFPCGQGGAGGCNVNLDGSNVPCGLAFGSALSTLSSRLDVILAQIAGASGGHWTFVQTWMNGVVPVGAGTWTFYPTDTLWGGLSNWLSGSAISVSGYLPLHRFYLPIGEVPFPVASLGGSVSLTWIPKTNTWCAGLSGGGAVPSEGKEASLSVYPSSNAAHTQDVVSSWGWSLSGQPSTFGGYSVLTNSSGTLGGYSAATSEGIQATYGWTGCKSF